METTKLNVGDRVYYERKQNWSNDIDFRFATVERLTKTQAILDNGTKLINEGSAVYYNNKTISFGEYGDKYKRWYIETPEVIERAKIENRRQEINSWFDSRKFTEEEKALIYNLFNID